MSDRQDKELRREFLKVTAAIAVMAAGVRTAAAQPPSRATMPVNPQGKAVLPRISVLNISAKLSNILQRLYSCGFQRDQALLEGETQWVSNRISRFSFPSTRL
jgi:hypothetical protein